MLYRRILPIHCEQLKRIDKTHPQLAKVLKMGLGMCIRRSGKAFASLWPDLCHEQVRCARLGSMTVVVICVESRAVVQKKRDT